MALINCPECSQQISELANSCPHCGYPLNTRKEDSVMYNVLILTINCSIRTFHEALSADYTYTIEDIYYIANHLPLIIEKNVSLRDAQNIKDFLERAGASVAIEPFSSNQNDEAIRNKYKRLTLKCPRCHSNAITTGTKGYGLIRGFLGSNKTVNRCGSCGYSWEP